METVLASPTREVVIGPDRPFVIVGERINPTGRRAFAERIAGGDLEPVRAEALAQVEAGAPVLDVNAGIPGADEVDLLVQMVKLVAETVDVPLCIDSSTDAALEAALAVYEGKALVNSVAGEEDKLERILPLVKRHGAAVIGLANDERGPLPDPVERLAVARRIVERAADHGIPPEDVVIDPLAMTVGADPDTRGTPSARSRWGASTSRSPRPADAPSSSTPSAGSGPRPPRTMRPSCASPRPSPCST
jgi:5-methyltetrahydrofolate--homocysteine methyltransferase